MRGVISAIVVAIVAACAVPQAAHAQTSTQAGTYNGHALPEATKRRMKATKASIPAKLRRTLDELKAQRLVPAMKRTAARYGIDPIHILAAVVGEHVFNYDIRDNLQEVALHYARRLRTTTFSCGGVPLETVLELPQFRGCKGSSNSYWTCVESTWYASVRGRTVGRERLPRRNLTESCFNPFATGQTYGLGQLSPVTALKMMDTTKLPKITYKDADALYERILDPDESINVIAAVIVDSIAAYRAVGVDISDRPGITATLYNVGNPWARARKSRGRPKVNYYGAYIEDHIAVLEDFLN
ncbi:DUF1402 family protein [Acuticoccus sp. I52.16.1]|uniref:DUF1402 family protein n=1 Tax=Acuticoccus sp. I52.16.1 TaxID=2928472 RepID=UPI001FD3A7E5|nr:DUF1402 family protein [Acuticoccus sp. I52.16.1]UOM33323.1 DUF1402 family protein [Acuticoccus sp. I52.16.1]